MLADAAGTRAVIAAPDAPEVAHLGARMAHMLRQVTGADFPVVAGQLIDRRLRESKHVIVIGDVSVNRFASELYRGIRTFEDRFYPGRGGWVVRSVHDTWGAGTNCLIAAGSDRQGHERAMEALVEKIAAAWPDPVGFLLDVHPVGEALDSVMELSTLVPYPQYAYRYLLAGDPDDLKTFRDGALSHEGEEESEWNEFVSFNHLRHLTLMPAWDLVEEGPLLCDAERARIASLYLYCYRSREGAEYFPASSDPKEPGPLIGNHASAAALNLYFAGHYFWLRYRLAEAREWVARGRRYLSHHWRNPRAGADMGYMEFCGTASDLLTCALHSGADDMLVSGMLKKAAERAILMCGNLGYALCEGEVGYDGKLISRNVMPHQFLARAAALTGDGRYQWWAQRPNPSRRGPGVHQRDSFFQRWDAGVEPQPPEDQVGLRWALADPTHFAANAPKWEGAGSLVHARLALDKLAFRSGLSPQDTYLAVGGLGVTGRGHEDAGAVLWYEAFGHVFLVDGGGTCAGAQNCHNSVVILKDGQGAEGVHYVTLDHAAQLGSRGFVALDAANYNGCRWQRSLYWRAGDRFLVIDNVTAVQEAQFAVFSRWNVLGESTRLDDGLMTAQRPRRLVDRDNATLRINCFPGSWLARLHLEAGRYTATIRVRPEIERTSGQPSMRLRVDGCPLPDIRVCPGSPHLFTIPEEPLREIEVTTGFEVESSGTHSLQMSCSCAPSLEVVAAALRDAEGRVTEIPLDDWRPGNEVVEDAGQAFFRIASDRHEWRSLGPALDFEGDWSLYPLAEPRIEALVERRSARLKPGEGIAFAHHLGASADEAPQLEVEQIAPGAWSLRDGETTGVLWDSTFSGESRPPFLDGERLLVEWNAEGDEAIFMGVSVRSVGEFPPALSLSEAGAFLWEPDKGLLSLDLPGAARLCLVVDPSEPWKVDGIERKPECVQVAGGAAATLALKAGRHTIEHPPISVAQGRLARALSYCREAAESGEPIAPAAPAAVKAETAEPVASLGSPVTALIAAGSDGIAFVAGTEWGEVFVGDGDLRAAPVLKAGGAVRSLAVADFGSGPVILAGSDDACLYALRPDGELLFSHKFEWTKHSRGRYSRHCEVLGIHVDDLDGDGVPEIYVGANNQTLYRLCRDGSVEWEECSGCGPASIMLSWPGARPQRGLLLASTVVSRYDNIHLLDLACPERAHLRYFIGIGWGALARKALVHDVDGDGEQEVILVSSGSLVRVFSAEQMLPEYPGDVPWAATKWEAWTGLPPVDAVPARPAGLWIATEAGFVNRHDGAGALVEGFTSPDAPVAVFDSGDDQDGIHLVTVSGLWHWSSRDGLRPIASVPEPVTRAIPLDGGARVLLATGTGDLFACRVP